MFSTVRFFIKTSIIFLLLGVMTGLYLLISRNFYATWPHPDIVSAHTHIILIGFIIMMIMGVALWFFPRPEKDDKLYKPRLILITYYIMTISTSTRFAFQILSALLQDRDLINQIILCSSIGQIIGMILFFISMWGRIRSVGSYLREAKGEKF